MTPLNNNEFRMKDADDAHRCERCGVSAVRIEKHLQTFPYGEGPSAVDLTVAVPVYSCEHCGIEYTDDAAEDIRHEAVCRHLGALTPAEVRAMREDQYGLSRERFAEITKFGIATIQRWESGALIQNPANDQYLRLLAYPENLEILRARSEGREPIGHGPSPASKVRTFERVKATPQVRAVGRQFLRPASERKAG